VRLEPLFVLLEVLFGRHLVTTSWKVEASRGDIAMGLIPIPFGQGNPFGKDQQFGFLVYSLLILVVVIKPIGSTAL
jgi:hypothetical protein